MNIYEYSRDSYAIVNWLQIKHYHFFILFTCCKWVCCFLDTIMSSFSLPQGISFSFSFAMQDEFALRLT